ncbi:hypothetical protein BG10_900 [Bacillus thuringiensis serovar morrisoni]|uniref:cobalamin biosynthesis protein n=1 Tax=Bacillus thuringiensis TaxID=1428 RepID=UPI0005AF2B09|nr:cobalamin biosynthesis protein [Bacillus thuringiensis]KIP29350.1 hypothetical protein BG10_900 [Bacillus thuringiensis serovar morrisoni]MED2074812.1 zinc-finger domain-containing protein [Bacillus thuringiensis]
MNAREKRIQILKLKNQYCKRCKHNVAPYQQCIQHCRVGKELARLDKKIFGGQPKRRATPCEKWDDRCKKAVALYDRGIEYPVIAKQVGCHVSGLYRELKKRGLLKMPKK